MNGGSAMYNKCEGTLKKYIYLDSNFTLYGYVHEFNTGVNNRVMIYLWAKFGGTIILRLRCRVLVSIIEYKEWLLTN